MLDIVNLSCARGDRPLFQGLGFSLRAGEFLHIQGANGSGKTTLLRTLCGLSVPVEGEILWRGSTIHALQEDYRGALCYVGHHNGLQGEFTAAENLALYQNLNGDVGGSPISEVLVQLRLAAVSHLPTKLLSQGQKRRLALARFLVAHKPLWIMDEPITALDKDSVTLMNTIFTTHLDRGGLIILTSHQQVRLASHPVRTLSLDT